MSDAFIEDSPQVYEGNVYQGEPIPVEDFTESFRPEFGACMTWLIPQFGAAPPVQILTRRIRRFKAKLIVTALTGATSVVFNSNQDHLSIPQGASIIAAMTLPDWESQQPLYAVAIGGTANISVFDFTYAER